MRGARHGFLIALLLQFPVAWGCAEVELPEAIAISPDRSRIVYIWDREVSEPVVDGRVLLRDFCLDIVDPAFPHARSTLHLGSPDAPAGGSPDILAALSFSPDSRYVAVVGGGSLWLVDVKSKSFWLQTGLRQRVTSWSWTNAGELGYGIMSAPTLPTAKLDKSLWIGRPGQGRGGQRRVYRGRIEFFNWDGLSEPADSWAPGGRHVIFVDEDRDRRVALLDVSTGNVRQFGRANADNCTVAWTGTGSCAFCISDLRGAGCQILLIHPDCGAADDLSGRAAKVFEHTRGRFFAPFWTGDGKYVVEPYAGLLVQPIPWKVLETGAVLRERLQISKSAYPQFFPVPVPGFIGVQAFSKAAGDGIFATTYDGREVYRLAPYLGMFAISKDGKLAATVDERRRVSVYVLNWPGLGSDGAEAQTKTQRPGSN